MVLQMYLGEWVHEPPPPCGQVRHPRSDQADTIFQSPVTVSHTRPTDINYSPMGESPRCPPVPRPPWPHTYSPTNQLTKQPTYQTNNLLNQKPTYQKNQKQTTNTQTNKAPRVGKDEILGWDFKSGLRPTGGIKFNRILITDQIILQPHNLVV